MDPLHKIFFCNRHTHKKCQDILRAAGFGQVCLQDTISRSRTTAFAHEENHAWTNRWAKRLQALKQKTGFIFFFFLFLFVNKVNTDF
jgi:hypothetical protein